MSPRRRQAATEYIGRLHGEFVRLIKDTRAAIARGDYDTATALLRQTEQARSHLRAAIAAEKRVVMARRHRRSR